MGDNVHFFFFFFLKVYIFFPSKFSVTEKWILLAMGRKSK